jgi:ABC-type branched-subunit amino acid transport system substrate-binding protein
MALLDLDYETSHYGHSLAIKAAEKYGIEIVYDEYYPGDIKDFSPFLIKSISKNPDVIFDTGTGGNFLALVVKQARDLGYKGFFMEPCPPAIKTNIDVAGAEAVEGMLGFGYASAGEGAPVGVKAFRESYIKKYGQWAEESLVVAVPLSAVLLGIEMAGSMDTDKIIRVLEAGHEWSTPYDIKGVFAGEKDYGRPSQWFAPQHVILTTAGKSVPADLIPLEELLKGWE